MWWQQTHQQSFRFFVTIPSPYFIPVTIAVILDSPSPDDWPDHWNMIPSQNFDVTWLVLNLLTHTHTQTQTILLLIVIFYFPNPDPTFEPDLNPAPNPNLKIRLEPSTGLWICEDQPKYSHLNKRMSILVHAHARRQGPKCSIKESADWGKHTVT